MSLFKKRNAWRQTIEGFFQRGPAVDLYLPNGWYGGRPMENQHELTMLIERPSRLIVEIDERILLTFTGSELTVEAVFTDLLDSRGTPSVRVGGFRQLVVDARLYGRSDDASAVVFREGDVCFVSAS